MGGQSIAPTLQAGVKKDSGPYTFVYHAADRGECRKAAGAFAEVIGVNTESAYRPWSTDVVRAGAGIGYCADRTRQSRSRYLNTVEML